MRNAHLSNLVDAEARHKRTSGRADIPWIRGGAIRGSIVGTASCLYCDPSEKRVSLSMRSVGKADRAVLVMSSACQRTPRGMVQQDNNDPGGPDGKRKHNFDRI
ncbi:hypothetical protein DTO027B5_1974 [Paecilomyces variotii]|nr:hypothetical protein DTO021C3_4826 [Paecilomyces variotii]KAJ9327586.1 hypothetical protein DTO027B3_1808 [Paecilomyces variotii]KAJ9336293.1 hypothetical protein DTO027B5_1974 [Paecilomyces variotii]